MRGEILLVRPCGKKKVNVAERKGDSLVNPLFNEVYFLMANIEEYSC